MMLVFINMSVYANESVDVNEKQNVTDTKIGNCEIFGKITDISGSPIIGAVIVNRATKKGVVTDLNGMYKMEVEKDATIEVLYAGYRKSVEKIGKGAFQEMNIVLVQDEIKDSQKINNASKNAELGLVLVDDEIYEKSLDEISAEKIEKITVIKYQKDLTPYIEKYGEKASNGVVLITLKK